MTDEMDIDDPKTKGKKEGKDSGKARFEVKKVNTLSMNRSTSIILTYLYSGMPCPFGPGVRSIYLFFNSRDMS